MGNFRLNKRSFATAGIAFGLACTSLLFVNMDSYYVPFLDISKIDTVPNADSSRGRSLLIENVCVDKDDRVISGTFPGHPNCLKQRDARQDDLMTYRRFAFGLGARKVDPKTSEVISDTRVAIYSRPVTRSNKERVVYMIDRYPFNELNEGDHGSIFGYQHGNWTSNLGSWFYGDNGNDHAYWGNTSFCTKYPNDVWKTTMNWPFTPINPTSAVGTLDRVYSPRSKIQPGFAWNTKGKCADLGVPIVTWSYNAGAHPYKNGYKYKTYITASVRCDTDKTYNGVTSKCKTNMNTNERYLMTDEFGLSEFQLWHRVSADPEAIAKAKRVFDRCTTTPNLNIAINGIVHIYSQDKKDYQSELWVDVDDKGNRRVEEWAMVGCNDYSQVEAFPAAQVQRFKMQSAFENWWWTGDR